MIKSSKKIVIHAGELVFGRGKKHIFTLLGSCVGITLWHPYKRYGGMCHFALPTRPASETGKLNPRYADDCIKIFQQAAADKGTQLREYEVKIFGGGNLLNPTSHIEWPPELAETQRRAIGDSNAAEAFAQLSEQGCQIIEADIGEFGYRKIWFNTFTGNTHVEYTPVTKINKHTIE